ncbi:MAG: TRAP transporter permease [Proteobacteria bacterium]|nr:TRAP transporter permease [Pseudomonadota bacterium]
MTDPKAYGKIWRVSGLTLTTIAIAMALFHIYTAGFETLFAYQQRVIHLMFTMVLTFLAGVQAYREKNRGLVALNAILVLASIAVSVYALGISNSLWMRSTDPSVADMVFGIVLIVLVLEATRRHAGLALPIISCVFLLYVFVGPYMPGILAHRGYSLERIVGQMFLTMEGIYGTALGVSATYVIMFVLFGAFLEQSGAGGFFIKLAFSLTGGMRGGPAKTAVVASALMGTISGSAVANTAGTGVLTIPLMKKSGYRPHVAGAIEAVASTGGQIMPPVMGAAAFVLAEFIGITYANVMLAAVIPAVLYFVSIFLMVDLEAAKEGLKGLPKEELPKASELIKSQCHLGLPVVVLVAMLIVGMTPLKAGFYGIIAIVVVSWFKKDTRMGLTDILAALESGAKQSLIVATACAAAGIVVGIVSLTGIGFRFSGLVSTLSGGNILLALFLTMIASLILGMGLPTTAAYIVLAALGAPALIKLGIIPLTAHFFIFYFSCLSCITPPVALAAYTGAGIAGAPAFKTGWTAMRLGLAAFIVPYMFVFGPALLMIGQLGQIVQATFTALVGVFALASGVQGWFFGQANPVQRIMLIIVALTLIHSGLETDIIGLVILLFVFAWQRFLRKPVTEKVQVKD